MKRLITGISALCILALPLPAIAGNLERFLASPRCLNPSPSTCAPLKALLRRPQAALQRLDSALDTPVDAHRIRILEALDHLPPSSTLPILLRLRSRDPSLAIRALALRALKGREEADRMTGIQALARSKEPADRVDAAANLSPPTDDAHVDLLRTLSTDPHESVSHAAIQALGQGDDPRLVEPLIAAAFESDLPESARHAALLALSRHALPERIPQALLLCAHPSAVIRKGALHALAAWNTTYGHAFIVAALEDNATIDTAAGVLARLGATWSAPTLLASLDRPELSATQRHRVISAIGSLGNPNAIGPLLNRLPGATGAESVSIARALGAIGAPSAIPTLIGLLESPDPTLQDAALGGLEGITGERLGRDPSGWRAWAQARMPSPIGDNSRKRRPLNQRSTLGAERTP